jgi:hypothetical protein
MTGGTYYRVIPNGQRWAVAHAVPGTENCFALDVDCLTESAAQTEADRMNAWRNRRLMTERQEAALLEGWS